MCMNMRRIWVHHSANRAAAEGRPGLQVEVPCHCCWQCRADKVRNWTGKALAEAATSAAVDFVTLTYCDRTSPEAHWIADPVEPGHAKDLHYEDVQKYLKRIRKAGHRVRYIVAGEYGDRKGRAHWHLLLFWQDGRPERFQARKKKYPHLYGDALLYGNEWQDEFWHHGHVNYQRFSEQAAKYVCKYLLKWDGQQGRPGEPTRKTKFNYSARPGIGFNWICDHWAQLHVERGLAPQSPKYSFPDVLRNGVRVDFRMSPHCAVKFVQEFERRWYEQRGSHPPSSDFCEKMLSKVAQRLVTDGLERRRYKPAPEDIPPGSGKIYFDEKLNAYFYLFGDNPEWNVRFYWSFDERGRRSWQRKLVTETEARRLEAADFAASLSRKSRTTTSHNRRAA